MRGCWPPLSPIRFGAVGTNPISAPDQRWEKVTEAWSIRLGLSKDQRRHAINKLEAAGLAEVKRNRNGAPEVRLVPWIGLGETDD